MKIGIGDNLSKVYKSRFKKCISWHGNSPGNDRNSNNKDMALVAYESLSQNVCLRFTTVLGESFLENHEILNDLS